MKKMLALALLAMAATGCTTLPALDPNSDAGKAARTMEAPKDGAALYVYRDRSSDFGIYQLILGVNDNDVITAPACYTRFNLKPGTYHLEAHHPDLLAAQQEMDVTVKPGDVKVLEFKPMARFGLPGESKLLVQNAEGFSALRDNQRLCIQPTQNF